MKSLYIKILSILFASVSYAQTANESNQNPNAQAAYEKYSQVAGSYISKQGTTSQQTYVAIDPIEEKRIRKKIRKDNRANRALWRHQERMERAKNTQYVVSRPYYRNCYTPSIANPLFYGSLGYALGRIRF